uniref:Uncharacterized protein n=1 Tax=Dicentrarchus labrax TaxID=13489 RepID=A0A8C4EFU1_DICLA
MANPETLLGEIEAKTRELIAKRTTPLLEYIKNKKIEKQVRKKKSTQCFNNVKNLFIYATCFFTENKRGEERGEEKEGSDKEQREQHGRRQRDKDHRGKDEERKRQRHHYEFDKFMRRKDETKWGKGYCQDRAKKEGHHHGYSYCPDSGDKLGKEDREDLGNRKERLRNKVSEKVSMRWGEKALSTASVWFVRSGLM